MQIRIIIAGLIGSTITELVGPGAEKSQGTLL